MTDDSDRSRGPASPFQFVACPASVAAEATERDLVVRIPFGISRKHSLFRCFASALQFPGYFGGNWDAFRECLLDLNWLDPPPSRIVVIHDDLPFVPGQKDLSIYLSLLSECGSQSREPQFHVVFSERHAQTIARQALC